MATDDPCGYCKSPVRIEKRPGQPRGGRTPTDLVRVCTNPDCPGKTDPKRLGGRV